MANSYKIYPARDNHQNLSEVLEYVATVAGHVRIVSVIWQPSRPDAEDRILDSGYTIIAEVDN